MYCKWCGMESSDEKKCSWCGKALAASPPADDTPLLEGIKTPKPEPPKAEQADADEMDPYIAEMVLTSDESVAVEHARHHEKPNKEEREVVILPANVRLEQYLGIMLLMVAAGMLVTHFSPDAWLNQFFPLLFISGLLLGVFRIIPDYDDDSMRRDVIVVAALSILVGPFYATIAYWFAGSVRQKMNTSLMSLMLSYLVIRFAIGSATQGLLDTGRYMLLPNMSLNIGAHLVELFPVAVLIGGWIAATYARGFIDELGQE